jgi:hypothetical protein
MDSVAWERWHQRCGGCERWWDLHSELHREVRARLWQWPCIQFKHWKPDLEAQALWRELEAALAEGQSSRN